ncbi:MAG: hypothetical protein ACREHF_03380 [Rhizomicrobium sp.]
MRGPLAAVLCLVPGICLAQMMPGAEPGVPPPSLTASAGVGIAMGKIGAIDSVGMSFVCGGNGRSRTYWITQATRFRTGAIEASFFDLRTGEPVEVTFHRSGGQAVADLVRLRT